MMLAPGTRLGSYEILAALAAGGMGEVYRARDHRLGRDVAVKVLPRDVSSDPGRLARFEREAKSVAALSHPNIVMLHSIEETNGTRFLTMELVEGQGLDRLVTPAGLPLERVLDIAIPLADALVAAHDRGIVHRDLKPANVMVTREGRVKVLDFGLAKLASSDAARDSGLDATQAETEALTISTAGQVVGTVPYMAPEQLRGEPVDARTDLFSLGIILFELLTGRRPFGGVTSADVGSSILRDPPTPVHSLRADLPSDLERVIGRCLEKDPERRLQTARDVRNELELLRRVIEKGDAGTSTMSTPGAAIRPNQPAAPAPAKESPSIAVLPFVNRSRDEDDEYFSDGLADELLNVLAKIRGLRVAARSSAFTFKGKEATVAEVGRALNVATVLEGSVRKSGNRVRIAVQLVKVSDGFHLWSETYDRTLDDIFAVQDDIARSVVKELRTTLLGEESDSKTSGETKADVAAAARGRGESGEAHRLFLKGRYLIERLRKEDMAKGIEYLHQALQIDPGHALAWAALSRAHSHEAGYGWATVTDGYARAREAVQRALALEPNLVEGHLALGAIQVGHDWDWKGADASYHRALQLAPGRSDVLRAAGSLALDLGRIEEAIDLSSRAIEQDPLSVSGYLSLGMSCRFAGRFAEAEQAFRRAEELAPQRITTHMMIGLILLEQGRVEDSLAEVMKEAEEWSRLTGLSLAQHSAGRREESDRALRALIEKYSREAAYQIAAVHAWRGETEPAFEWLDRAVRERDAGLAAVKCEPTFARLHGDPRWAALMERLGLAD